MTKYLAKIRKSGTDTDCPRDFVGERVPLKAIMEQSLLGVFLIFDDGKIASANGRFAMIVGQSVDALIGRDVFDFVLSPELEQIKNGLVPRPNGEINASVVLSKAPDIGPSTGILRASVFSTEVAGRHAYVGLILDASGDARLKTESERSFRVQRAINACNQAVISAECLTDFLSQFCRILVKIVGYQNAWVVRAGEGTNRASAPLASFGPHQPLPENLNLPWATPEGALAGCGIAIQSGGPAEDSNFNRNPIAAPCHAIRIEHNIGSNAAIPVTLGAGVKGAVIVASTDMNLFRQAELELILELSQTISGGIDIVLAKESHRSLQDLMKSSLHSTIYALALAVESRDPFTAGHQRNVANLCAAICAELCLSAEETEGIVLAAGVHDIGKLHVPLEICCKSGKLSVPEIQLIQSHADIGYQILRGIDFPWPVAEMVREHHERCDGSGYPQGLRESQILLGAQIIAVADVVEAMMSHRPYRPALGPDAAIAEIRRGRGLSFSPVVVDACIALSCRHDFLNLALGDRGSNEEPENPALGAASINSPGGIKVSTQNNGRSRLTLQQSAVIQLLSEGKSVKEIARKLNIAPGTVKTHLSIAYKALGAKNRIEAVMRARFHHSTASG